MAFEFLDFFGSSRKSIDSWCNSLRSESIVAEEQIEKEKESKDKASILNNLPPISIEKEEYIENEKELEKNALILNNLPSKEWMESFMTKYEWTGCGIMTECAVYIYNPFNNKDLESSAEKLNELKSKRFGCIDQELAILQLKCHFYSMQSWLKEIVCRGLAVPQHLYQQHLFKMYFKQIMDEYMNTSSVNEEALDLIYDKLDEIRYVSFYESLIFGYIASIKQGAALDICLLIAKFHPIFYDPTQ